MYIYIYIYFFFCKMIFNVTFVETMKFISAVTFGQLLHHC